MEEAVWFYSLDLCDIQYSIAVKISENFQQLRTKLASYIFFALIQYMKLFQAQYSRGSYYLNTVGPGHMTGQALLT